MAMICTVTQTWNTDRPFFLFGDIWRVWVCVCILVAACDHWQSLFNTLPVCIREWLTQRIQCLRTHAHSGMCGRDCVVFCSPPSFPRRAPVVIIMLCVCVCMWLCACIHAGGMPAPEQSPVTEEGHLLTIRDSSAGRNMEADSNTANNILASVKEQVLRLFPVQALLTAC